MLTDLESKSSSLKPVTPFQEERAKNNDKNSEKPQFNAKYIDNDLHLYLNTNELEASQRRNNSADSAASTSPSTSRNPSNYISNSNLIDNKLNMESSSNGSSLNTTHSHSHSHGLIHYPHSHHRPSVDSGRSKTDSNDTSISNVGMSRSESKDMIGSVSMGSSKSYTSFLSLKNNDRSNRSSTSSKKSSKRSSIFNRFLPSRRQSESAKSTDLPSPRTTSVSSKKSHPLHPLTPTKPQFSPKLNAQHDSHLGEHFHHEPLNNQSYMTTSVVRGRLPSEQGSSHLQPLSQYRHPSVVPAPHHGQQMRRSSTIESVDLNDAFLSVPMSTSNTLAQSYGVSLLDENYPRGLSSIGHAPVEMTRVASVTDVTAHPTKEKPSWRAPESWKVRSENSEIPSATPVPSARGQESDISSTTSFDDSAASPNPDSAVNLRGPTALETIPSASASDSLTSEVPSASKPILLSNTNEGKQKNNNDNNNNNNTSGKTNNLDSKLSVQRPVKKTIKELPGSSRSSVRIFKGEKSSLLPCTIETTSKDILDVLRRKKFLKQDDDHMLVLKCGGLTRTLPLDERPLKIQRKMLFLYGYTERDNLDFIERTDLSFLFKFVVQEKGVEIISEERKGLINPQFVNLDNWNLQDIPNFLYAEPISTLDVSQNPSFGFTNEFMHDSRNLTVLSFTRSGSPVFPLAITHAPRLSVLNLEVNYIKHIPDEIQNLHVLKSLNLACNRISRLPDRITMLYHLELLNLSSNRLKKFPPQIFKLRNLKHLDVSYNAILELPQSLSSLENLELLQVAGNRITGDLPAFFDDLHNLIKVDLRFNKLTSIDALRNLEKLEVIRATGNMVSVFRSKAPHLFEVELNMNPLTYVHFETNMNNLKVVDFSKGKLTSCSFVTKLTAVEKLVLDYNHLSVLPDTFDVMPKLQHLSIVKNNITNIPDSLCRLEYLKILDLHLNNIGRVNEKIWTLKSLKLLNLASNLLETFPEPSYDLFNSSSQIYGSKHDGNDDSVFISDESDDNGSENSGNITILPKSKMASKNRRISENTSTSLMVDKRLHGLTDSLKDLCLCDNKLTENIFPTISLFRNLECLNISYNDFFDLPLGYLSRLSKLRTLFMSGNYLSSLPLEDLDNVNLLHTLHLNGNRFGTLPAELYKLTALTSLDVGSNQLKYNIGNIPYDWNWCYNKNLKYLNFSGNKRLEIKPQQNYDEETGEKLDSFLGLKNLKMLGLMDVTITTDAVPDQSVSRRIRSTASQIGDFGYGISDTLGLFDALSTRDVVIEKFRGKADEFLITIYDGKNSVRTGGHKISKIIQETFEIHLAEELEGLGQKIAPGVTPKTVEDCLRGAFLTMNSEMSILINKDESLTFSSAAVHRTKTTDKLTLEEDGLSGCAATIIYIKKDYVYIANVGDIMGILTKANGEFNIITTKHEPYAPKEYERIRDSGGYVTTDGYLDGVSDVSRAVGFFKLMPHINAKPSIHKFKLTQNEEMIAICTNEIWKRVSFELAADIIRQEKSNPIGAAEKLRDFSISYGSKGQKLTAMVLSLRQFASRQKHNNAPKPEDSTLRKLDDEIEPPIGELAMVFTDIKNSTLLWDNYPTAMRSAIKVHNAIMRRQLRIIGGYEVKTEGDAFIVSFPTPTAALLWCFAVQTQLLTTNEWPEEIISSDQGLEIKDNDGNLIFRGLSVRMGIHWGTPVCEMDVITKRMDYFGPMVNRASRVSAVADGGQITISTDFYNELRKARKIHQMVKTGKLDPNGAYGYRSRGSDVENQLTQLDSIGIVLESIGAKKLKGLEAPENIWLAFPRPLSSRLKILTNKNGEIDNKLNKLAISGITPESAWALRRVALRLEKIASYLASYQSAGTVNQYKTFTDGIQRDTENTLNEELTNIEPFMLLFLDHTITRIENCVTVLGTRQLIGVSKTNGCDTVHLIDLLREMTWELQALRNRVGELEPGKKKVEVGKITDIDETDRNNETDRTDEIDRNDETDGNHKTDGTDETAGNDEMNQVNEISQVNEMNEAKEIE